MSRNSPGIESRNVLFCHLLYVLWIPMYFIDDFYCLKKSTNIWKTGIVTVKLIGNSTVWFSILQTGVTWMGCIRVAFGMCDSGLKTFKLIKWWLIPSIAYSKSRELIYFFVTLEKILSSCIHSYEAKLNTVSELLSCQ